MNLGFRQIHSSAFCLLFLFAASASACSRRDAHITPATVAPEALRAQRDKFTAALAAQLEAISYKAIVTHEGERVDIRVGQIPGADVRKAICRQRGWPSSEGRMARFDDTLRFLHESGITKVRIIGDAETADVELEKGGRCKRSS